MPNTLADLMKYGKRYGSNQFKQAGYFGEIPLQDGNVATEYSVGQDINGKSVEMPSIVPTLSAEEIDMVKRSAMDGSRLPDSVYQKAMAHAKQRISNGQSPFWGIPEKTQPMPARNGLADLIGGY